MNKKNQANLSKPSKPWLISKTCSPWNPRPELNWKAQFPINLMFKDEIEKKINLKFLSK